MSVILAVRRQDKKDSKFKTDLGYIMSSGLYEIL